MVAQRVNPADPYRLLRFLSAAFLTFANEETFARFPIITLQLQGTQAVARPRSYVSRSQNAMGLFVHPGIANGGEGHGTWVIGDSFLTDNLVRFKQTAPAVESGSEGEAGYLLSC